MGGLGKGLLVSGVLLALLAPPAQGAVTRAEYAVQVNPICVTAEGEVNRINKRYTKKIKGAKKLNLKQFSRVFLRTLAIDQAALAQIAAIPAAPGDENLVAEWIRNRSAAYTLNRRLLPIFVKILRLDPDVIDPPKGSKAKKPSKKQLNQAIKLFTQLFQLSDRLEQIAEADYLIGTELGLSECVTKPGEGDFLSAPRAYAAFAPGSAPAPARR